MKKIRIQLANPQWIRQPQCEPQCEHYLRGAVFIDGVMHRTPNDIASSLPQPGADGDAWGGAIARLNGFFAVVWQSRLQVVAAVDRIRSIPLFYGQNSEAILISDDAEWIRQGVGDDAMDAIAHEEFQLAGYVTGKDTLYPNVKQLQPGELLIVDKTAATPAVVTYRYYRFLHTEQNAGDEKVLRQALEHSAMASVRRLIDYADGRQITVPLSGGYDSRLIATLLCQLGYKNIVAFTYGFKGNKESAYSRQVAQALGLAWHFVEYSDKQWRSAWDTDQRRQYQKWASGWTSLPHIQDWVAVRALRNNRTVEKDCIFVPGHSGDFVAGSHIPDEAFQDSPVSIDTLVEKIFQKHYAMSGCKSGPQERRSLWRERVIDRAEVTTVDSHTDFANAFEKWDWQERQAKFIVNAVRVYEFFGYDWWLPLWDAEFMQFWQGVPLNLRQGRRWYLAYVKRAYASQTGTDAENSLNNASEIGILGRSIRSAETILPIALKNYLKALRHAVVPKQATNAYAISHLPASEIKQRLSAGYCVNGLLVEEFLRSVR